MLKKLFIAGTLLAASVGANAGAITLSPVSQNVNLGNTAGVDVLATVTAGTAVGEFDLTVLFDSTKVQTTGISFLGFLGARGTQQTNTDLSVAGAANAAELSLETTATLLGLQTSQPFALFHVDFQGIGLGVSPLSFKASPRILGDGNGSAITLDSVGTGSITVLGGTGVPEPSTIGLFAVGGLALLGKRLLHQRL